LCKIIISRVGRKGAIYIQKGVLKRLGINEGDRVLIKLADNKVILEFISDPLSLALKVKK